MINKQLENQFTPHHIDIWYDKHSRNWIVQLKDIYGNQIGNAKYQYSKLEALQAKEELQKEYNVS